MSSKRAKIGGLFEGIERRDQHAAFRRPLAELDKVIDWEFFRDEIRHAGEYSDFGRPSHDPVLMFKIIVLQRYYDLSEEQTEFQILDRLSFQQFLGLEHGGRVPDKNSIWDFKERLGKDGVEGLFKHFDAYLLEAGLLARGGSIIDASFVDVPRQHNTRAENEKIREGGVPEDWSEKKRAHKDTDARWTQKNGEKHFGFKNHGKVDKDTKLIEAYTVTDAAVHDSQCIERLLDAERDTTVWADSAYRSEKISGELTDLDIANEIHERGYRNHPLTETQKKSNREKSRVRARVEHVFAFQKIMGGDRLRTIGLERTERGIGLINVVYNMFRFAQLGYSMK